MRTAETEISYPDVEILYAFLNILKLVSNTNDFRLWIKITHNIENDNHIFCGYHFFIDVIVSHIIHALERHSSFGVDSDYSMWRASFVGVHIDDIPNTCENVKLLKNLWYHYRAIRKCKNWKELIKQLEEKNNAIFPVFDKIFTNAIESRTDVPKEEILLEKSIYWTFIYLNDTRQGCPFTYPGTILDSFVNKTNFDKVFVRVRIYPSIFMVTIIE